MIVLAFFCNILQLNATQPFISPHPSNASMTLVEPGVTPLILINSDLDAGIKRAVENLRTDFGKVTGVIPSLSEQISDTNKPVVIIGTLGTNSLVDRLVKNKQIKESVLKGKNEKYIIQYVSQPVEGIKEALVIAGSDKRGTIYGIYELSKQLGVSPWYYWADVPVVHKECIYFQKGEYSDGEPAVRFRGIFLNDEAPALTKWANVTFGGFNSKFYEKVFELLLRLKANFLWPAMWNNAFYDDDPQNGILANEMGIIMGTSHHEPMAMAQQDWHRFVKRNNLQSLWNYTKNTDALNQAWKYGIERSRNWEKVITLGMRGDGDEAMQEGTNIELLQKIVSEQRKIIEKVTGKKADQTPQVWALYKEVQDYYDHGMQVPDDVTLLFCDDNWGNVRRLPVPGSKPRKGGYGMYYHFDYVGAPRNSKWINISPIQRVWEQMNLSYTHGVDKMWIVNVGDLKPMEYPISFFMDMAWNPAQFNSQNLLKHTEDWCTQQFGEQYAKKSARIINLYSKYNRRITPEMLSATTYSLENYNEFERVVNEYRNLSGEAFQLYYSIPQVYKDAFDQLVLFPVNACSNLYEMYFAVAKNKYYAEKNDTLANFWADKARECFLRDSVFTDHYNKTISGGKWNHMMDQIRIGYSSWQEPAKSIMPAVTYIHTQKETRGKKVFQEKDGYVSMEAENFSNVNNSGNIHWEIIPDLGKNKSAISTFPQNAYPENSDQVYVEYDIDFKSAGNFDVAVWLSPTLNFNQNKGLRYQISFDNNSPQTVNFNGRYRGELGKWQAEQIIKSITNHLIEKPGRHTLRFRVLDPGIVLQKIIINTGGLKPSWLGPQESPMTEK